MSITIRSAQTVSNGVTLRGHTPPSSRGGNGIRLMGRWDNAEWWGGRLAVVRIYDNALDLTGVLQNYNAERSRFGL
jgi:hypothetical protein